MYQFLSEKQMQEQIFKLLTGIQSDVSDQKADISAMKANQDHMKESIDKIDKKIGSIEETDRSQTKSLEEHMRRTKLNETAVKALHETIENTVDKYHSLVLQVSKPKVRKPLGDILKDNVNLITKLLIGITSAVAGALALLKYFA